MDASYFPDAKIRQILHNRSLLCPRLQGWLEREYASSGDAVAVKLVTARSN